MAPMSTPKVPKKTRWLAILFISQVSTRRYWALIGACMPARRSTARQ